MQPLTMKLIVSIHEPDVADPENLEGVDEIRDFVKEAVASKDVVEFRRILREHIHEDVSEAEAVAIHNRNMEFRTERMPAGAPPIPERIKSKERKISSAVFD